jgi:hypothetical protein
MHYLCEVILADIQRYLDKHEINGTSYILSEIEDEEINYKATIKKTGTGRRNESDGLQDYQIRMSSLDLYSVDLSKDLTREIELDVVRLFNLEQK